MWIHSSGNCVVHLGVKGGSSEQHRVLLWCDTEFIVEGVVPDFLHVIPFMTILWSIYLRVRIPCFDWASSLWMGGPDQCVLHLACLGHASRAVQPDAQVDRDK